VISSVHETDSPLRPDAASACDPPAKGTQMNDVVAVALAVAFFAVAAAFVYFCDKVR
jgi:hypothetical protein